MCKYAQIKPAFFALKGCGSGRQTVVPPNFFPPMFIDTLSSSVADATPDLTPYGFSSPSVSFPPTSWPEGLDFPLPANGLLGKADSQLEG